MRTRLDSLEENNTRLDNLEESNAQLKDELSIIKGLLQVNRIK